MTLIKKNYFNILTLKLLHIRSIIFLKFVFQEKF